MPWDASGNFALSDTIAPATNADANELQAILTDIGVGIDTSFANDGQSTMTGAIKGADGTAALPGYSFSSDLNSGFYRIGADNIGLSLGGTKRWDYGTAGASVTGTLTASGQILATDGTKTAPGHSFSGDVDTGVYRIGANNLGISCGDTKIFDISTTAVAITGTFAASGDVAINTNKFTVAASSGNTVVAGTLGVTGASTFTGKGTFNALLGMGSVAYASTTAGDHEYDGKAFANNPVASDRGISPSIHFLTISADQTGTDVNTAQTWFPGGGPTSYNALAGTTYIFQGELRLSRSAGSTSHTISVTLGGGATATFGGQFGATSTAGSVLGTMSFLAQGSNSLANNVVVTAASTATNEQNIIWMRGYVRVTVGGTIIPQFTFSAAPGGAPTITRGSYFQLFPVGDNTVNSVGNWS